MRRPVPRAPPEPAPSRGRWPSAASARLLLSSPRRRWGSASGLCGTSGRIRAAGAVGAHGASLAAAARLPLGRVRLRGRLAVVLPPGSLHAVVLRPVVLPPGGFHAVVLCAVILRLVVL